jgi:hypothetical protein
MMHAHAAVVGHGRHHGRDTVLGAHVLSCHVAAVCGHLQHALCAVELVLQLLLLGIAAARKESHVCGLLSSML